MKKIYYCSKCGKTWGLDDNQSANCPCGGVLRDTNFTVDEWHTKTEEEKEALRNEFGNKVSSMPLVAEKQKSDIGSTIKMLSLVVGAFALLGGLIIMSESFALGLVAILMNMLFCSICYGIGEICTLLKSIDNRLKR